MELKKFLYILVFVVFGGNIFAQDAVDSLQSSDESDLFEQIDSLNAVDLLTLSDSISNFPPEMAHIEPLPFDVALHDYFIEKAFTIDCERKDSGAVYYSDSVYMARLQSMPHVMEMTYNRVVKAFIERYARCPKDVGYMLGIGNAYYFPMFEEALERHNVPLELKYLPVIESALNATTP